MIKDIYEVIKEAKGTDKFISEDAVINLIGIYGLTRLVQAGLLNSCVTNNGSLVYLLNPILGAEK